MSDLRATLAQFFPGWLQLVDVENRLLKLTAAQVDVLNRVLLADVSAQSTASKRDESYKDFYQFDGFLAALHCDLLRNMLPIDALLEGNLSSLFGRDPATESFEQLQLQKNGYQVSGHRLNQEQLHRIEQEIKACRFVNRGIFTKEFSGEKVLEAIQAGDYGRFTGLNGDTLWAKDLDWLCQNDCFAELAFDPYILSTAARYLGCTPVHVQTNVWFSFPTYQDRNNLSTNAQMFHQDKEFTKFLKVFIYLSDVGEESGPHCYVEGSHIDEAHTFGVQFSDRISDDEITRYYQADRIKTLLGPAGTITFGDTSCVHKGQPVVSGYRIMLQLEYAASLYLSPVAPFEQMPDRLRQTLPYPRATCERLIANYNSTHRSEFLAREYAARPAEPSALRKLLRMAKRYVKPA
jgi:Phytanoyl-CoA dioxygenase (PhyH)